MSYEVNYDGMESLASAGDSQESYLRSTVSFVEEQCGPGVFFSGFIGMAFGENYATAYGLAHEGLSDGPLAAAAVASTVRSNADQYRRDDAAASERLTGVGLTPTPAVLQTIGPASPRPFPVGAVMEPVATAGSGLDVANTILTDITEQTTAWVAPHPWDTGPPTTGNPLAPVETYAQVATMVETTIDGVNAKSDQKDYQGFIDRMEDDR